MKYHDIEVGKYYLYDKDNENNRIDTDICVVKVISKGRKFYKPMIQVYPVIAGKPEATPVPFYIYDERKLSEMSDNPADNVVIRYPANVPSFSMDDVNVISKVFMYALNHVADCKLTDQEVLKMSTMVQKIKFYTEISEKYRPYDTGGDKDGGK